MTMSGEVTVRLPYGQDRDTGEWFSPVRLLWGLERHQRLTPELQQRLCLTAAATFSYERAAEVVACWRGPLADDSTIHRHVGQAGARAREEEKRRERDATIPARREEIVRKAGEENPPRSFSLVIMMDGWMARERGPDWGKKPAQAAGDRVCWREMKTGIVLRVEDRAKTASGRPLVIGKGTVAHQGERSGLARKLYAEALRRGLNQAREVFVVADGGIWIWNLKEERFTHATGVLDLYHASQHLWAAARALFGEEGDAARKWVEPLIHQLSHGGEAGVLETLNGLGELLDDLDEERRKTAEQVTGYFNKHKDHIHYEEVARRGCPKGSGAMESTCAQLQGRLKRTGQFWTEEGKANLLGIELARRNHDWPQIWQAPMLQT
jgi:hypothetical protein